MVLEELEQFLDRPVLSIKQKVQMRNLEMEG